MEKNRAPRNSANQEPASNLERKEKLESLEKIREKIKSDPNKRGRDLASNEDNRPDHTQGPPVE